MGHPHYMSNPQNTPSSPELNSNIASIFFPESSKIADSAYEQNLRRSIIAIHNDASLTPAQKAKHIQALMNPNKIVVEASKLEKKEEFIVPENNFSVATDESLGVHNLDYLSEFDKTEIVLDNESLRKSYYQPNIQIVAHENCETISEEPEFGCTHYKTNCKISAECCKKWVPCRFCHNENSNHEIDRKRTRFCLCMHCNTVQRASKRCINNDCKRDLAIYYCDSCKFWDNDINKNIFHCDKCDLCRVGVRENYIHCDKCNACLATEYYKTHKCIERSLECDCPICGEFLFTTIAPIIFMPCGHGIHFFCHRDHLQSSYQCPICLKSVTDMTHFFNQLDTMLANHQMPTEYANIKSLVLCNDCEKKSTASFHFVYHKCGFCKSYNTKLLKTFNEDAMEIDDAEMDIISDES